MAMGAGKGAPDPSGFGKRGQVRLSPQDVSRRAARQQEQAPAPAVAEPAGGFGGAFSSIPNPMKWAGGGLAVLALGVMLAAGTGGGGGGFLGGLLGGMLARSLMNTSQPATTTARPTPSVSPSTSPSSSSFSGGSAAHTDVARGGFGASASSHGGSSSS